MLVRPTKLNIYLTKIVNCSDEMNQNGTVGLGIILMELSLGNTGPTLHYTIMNKGIFSWVECALKSSPVYAVA